MNTPRYGLALAAREHLLEGIPLTRLEAIILYGVANLPALVTDLRRQGWVIESRNFAGSSLLAATRAV